jgi:hypothetical protein
VVEDEERVEIPLRSCFADSALPRNKGSGITEPGLKTAYLPRCSVIKATLISRNAVSRTVSHTPIAMDV